MMLAITMPIYVIFSCRKRQQLASILVIFAFLAVGIWALQAPILENIKQYQARMEYEEKAGYTFSERTLLMQEGLDNFLESPWLGTGSNALNPSGASKVNTAHNTFLFIAVHYGIWPTLFFFILWMIILWKSLLLVIRRKQWHLGDLPYELFAFTIFLFLMSNTSNFMMFAPFSILYMTKVLTMQPNKEIKRNGTS
jgi:O-antigen ligase